MKEILILPEGQGDKIPRHFRLKDNVAKKVGELLRDAAIQEQKEKGSLSEVYVGLVSLAQHLDPR
jgi:hypothetical protein